jgi:uncharacterized protein YsxB (DUF464 family)
MIDASFYCKNGHTYGMRISGHAEFADYGEDIVCAAVSSATQMTCNGITDVLMIPASVSASDNLIQITVPENEIVKAEPMLKSLQLQLQLLSQEYPGTIQLKLLEE